MMQTTQSVPDHGVTTRDLLRVTEAQAMTIALPIGARARIEEMGWTLTAVERADYSHPALGAWSRWIVEARTPSGDVYAGGSTAAEAVEALIARPVQS